MSQISSALGPNILQTGPLSKSERTLDPQTPPLRIKKKPAPALLTETTVTASDTTPGFYPSKAEQKDEARPKDQDKNAEFLEHIEQKIAEHKDYINAYIDDKVDTKSEEFFNLYKRRVDALKDQKKNVTALATDTSAFSSDDDENAPPRTARLWANLLTRSCFILPLSALGAYIDHDNMTTGETFVSAILWPSEDVPALIKRYNDIRKGAYREKPLPPPNVKYKDVKNIKDYSRYLLEQGKRFWEKYGLTIGAIRTTLPFVAFDILALTTDTGGGGDTPPASEHKEGGSDTPPASEDKEGGSDTPPASEDTESGEPPLKFGF